VSQYLSEFGDGYFFENVFAKKRFFVKGVFVTIPIISENCSKNIADDDFKI